MGSAFMQLTSVYHYHKGNTEGENNDYVVLKIGWWREEEYSNSAHPHPLSTAGFWTDIYRRSERFSCISGIFFVIAVLYITKCPLFWAQ